MDDSQEDEEVTMDDVPEILDLSGDITPALMGDTPDWLTGADAYILFVLTSGLTLTPGVIAENTGVSRVTVSRRLSTLRAGGLVEKVDRGKYKITADGAFAVTNDPEVYEQYRDAKNNETEE